MLYFYSNLVGTPLSLKLTREQLPGVWIAEHPGYAHIHETSHAPRVDGDDRPVPLGRLRPDGRVPVPEADPHRQPGGPLGRAGGARLHRQPSPSWLRSARCCLEQNRPAVGGGSLRVTLGGQGLVEQIREEDSPVVSCRESCGRNRAKLVRDEQGRPRREPRWAGKRVV